MIEPWVLMNFHQAYEYLYLSQTVDAREAHRLGMVNRVVPREELDDTAEVIAQQIAQAPLSVLMGIKAGVKRAWETMGMRVHLQSQFHLMGRSPPRVMWRPGATRAGRKASGPLLARSRRSEPKPPPRPRRPATDLNTLATRWPGRTNTNKARTDTELHRRQADAHDCAIRPN